MEKPSNFWQSLTEFCWWERHNFGFKRPKDGAAVDPKLQEHVEKELLGALTRIAEENAKSTEMLRIKIAIESRGFEMDGDKVKVKRLNRRLFQQQNRVEAAEISFSKLWNRYAEAEVLKPSWGNQLAFRNMHERSLPRRSRNVLTSAFE